jgi:hypothetical protein
MPVGLVVGPLVGAFAGELLSTRQTGKALRVALLSFLSFLLSTGYKVILCLVMTAYTMAAIWHHIW